MTKQPWPHLDKNVPGDWYTNGQCMACGAPEVEAPELLSQLTDDNWDTYFLRQPQTAEEVSRACQAARVCCVSAVRYGGRDPEIILRLGETGEFSDFVLDATGQLLEAPPWPLTAQAAAVPVPWWKFWKRDA